MFAFDRYWRLLSAYLLPLRGRLALLATLVLGGIGLQLASPQIIGRFIDATQAGATANMLVGLALTYIAVAVAQRLASLGALYLGEDLGWRATNSLRADLARHTLGLDMGFHKAHTPGELIERLDGDVTALANFFSQFSVRVLGNALLILGVLALLWREDWRVGLGLAVYAALALFALAAMQRAGEQRWALARAAQADTFGFLEERLSGTEEIRASGAEAHTLSRFEKLMQATMLATRRARMAGNLAFAATTFLTTIGYAAGLALGALLYNAGQVSIGTAYLIVAYVGMLSTPLERLREEAQDLQQAGGSIERIEALLAVTPLVRDPAQPATLPAGPLGVEFERVSFTYEDAEAQRNGDTEDAEPSVSLTEPDNGAAIPLAPPSAAPALDSITFSIAPGEVLGLLGRTGSGKTTLSRLLFRLYDPQAGSVRLGGRDLRELSLADLRSRVGMVTQEVQIFHASVRDNLTLFDPTIDDARVEAALRELGLWEWASGLPQGLDTPLGGTSGLSAGEAQLLAFARVFLRDPGLVILDEASSRLDPATERLLERAVDRLLAGRSGIIIAHRLSTVERADTVVILEDGQIAEIGPRAALAADESSRFARLLHTGIEEVLA